MSDKKNRCCLLLALIMMILALVVGFIFDDCNKDMSTWLLVYGLMDPIICTLIMITIYFALPSISQAMKERRSGKDIVISLLPGIIFTIIVVFGFIIFNIAWTIYGAFLFFPAVASGAICADGKDGKALVLTGTIIVSFKIIICLCQTLPMLTNVNKKRSSSGSVQNQTLPMWRARS